MERKIIMKIKRIKKWHIISGGILIFLLFCAWIIWANTALEVNIFTIMSDRLPASFDGFRIAQVSDLHNAEFGEENEKLIELLEETEPDIITMTGDLIDSRNTDIEIAISFVKRAVEVAPCYYVTGNHEARLSEGEYTELEQRLVEAGVIVLHDEEIILEQDGERISLIGIDDPDFCESHEGGIGNNMAPERMRALAATDGYTILLSHRPEYFSQYCEAEMDLVLSGHAHGGQFRLPFVGGLFVPNQGFFPEYDSGLYVKDGTNMIVSRGLGNSIIPIRFNNRPEIVVVELGVEN